MSCLPDAPRHLARAAALKIRSKRQAALSLLSKCRILYSDTSDDQPITYVAFCFNCGAKLSESRADRTIIRNKTYCERHTPMAHRQQSRQASSGVSQLRRQVVSALNPSASNIMKVLEAGWPNLMTIKPADVGMAEKSQAVNFVRVIQGLCDEGLLTYEALIADRFGPRVIDATLTARGRLALSENLKNDEAHRRT
jgi:hypothetical protein